MRENLREIRLISHIETRTCGRRHTPHAHTHTYKQYIDASDSDSLSLSLGRMTYSDDDVDDIEVTIHHHHSSLSLFHAWTGHYPHIYIYRIARMYTVFLIHNFTLLRIFLISMFLFRHVCLLVRQSRYRRFISVCMYVCARVCEYARGRFLFRRTGCCSRGGFLKSSSKTSGKCGLALSCC